MEESVDLHEEAGKENEQTLVNLNPAEETTSKDEVEIDVFVPFLSRWVFMGESWPRSLVQTSLRSVCTGTLGQDSPIQTSRSVNKS